MTPATPTRNPHRLAACGCMRAIRHERIVDAEDHGHCPRSGDGRNGNPHGGAPLSSGAYRGLRMADEAAHAASAGAWPIACTSSRIGDVCRLVCVDARRALCSDHLGPDQVPVVGAQVPHAHCAARPMLDRTTVLRRHRPLARGHLRDPGRRDVEVARQFSASPTLGPDVRRQ